MKLSDELKCCLDGSGCGNCEHHEVDTKFICRGLLEKAHERIKWYEELEEQGKLLKLPCKVRDSLYIPYSRPWYIKEIKVQNFMYDGCDFHINTDFVTLSIRDIGLTAFLTKSEAESALQKMNEMEGKE